MQILNFVHMDWVVFFGFAVRLCLILLAIVYVCNVWFASDDVSDLRIRIHPLWLQRLCRFFLVVVGMLLPVLDVIFMKECVTPDPDGNILIILGGFCVMGAVFFLLALVYSALVSLIAFILKKLAEYVWDE